MMARWFHGRGIRSDPRWFFIAAVAFHVNVYWFGIFFLFMRDSGLLNSFLVDFYTVFMKATEIYLDDPGKLYVKDLYVILVYRNLPACIYYYLPFYFLPSDGYLNLVIFSSVTLGWNMITCYLIWRITHLESWKRLASSTRFNAAWWIMGIYLLSPHHVGEYSLGQVNTIAGFFILLGLYFHFCGKEHYAFMCVSISLYFKIWGALILLLMLFSKKPKSFTLNVFFTIMVQGPNLLLFLAGPTMLHDFLSLNMQSGELYNKIAYSGWGTGSTGTLSVFLTQPLEISPTVPTIIVLAVILPVILITLRWRGHVLNEVDKWMVLILTCAISIPAFYTVHVFAYLGVYSCWLVLTDSKRVQASKFILGIPTFSMFLWFFFPLITFLYIVPVFAIVMKAWSKNDPKQDA